MRASIRATRPGSERAARAERDVVAAALEVDVLGRAVDVEADLGVAPPKISQIIALKLASIIGGTETRSSPRAARPAHARLGVVDGVEHDAGVAVERLARVGEGEAARRPAEKRTPSCSSSRARRRLMCREGTPSSAAARGQGSGLHGLREGEELGGLEGVVHLDQILADASNC